jgi:hypothetical protein
MPILQVFLGNNMGNFSARPYPGGVPSFAFWEAVERAAYELLGGIEQAHFDHVIEISKRMAPIASV